MAIIYNRGGIEKCVILAPRELMAQSFYAPGWTDLRVGFFLSLTAESPDDNVITGLTEEIGDPVGTAPSDRYKIGITDRATGLVYMGFTNNGDAHDREISRGTSKVTSSNKGNGGPGDYWRVENGVTSNWSLQIFDQHHLRGLSGDGSQIHFAQSNIGTTGPAGYTTLLMLRFTRPDASRRNKIITMSCKRDTVNHSGDVLFSDTPTLALLDAQLHAFPTVVQTLGPVDLSLEPDTIILYWPFVQSRLRIHAMGILKAG